MRKRVKVTWRGIAGTHFSNEYDLVDEDAQFVLKQDDGSCRPLTDDEMKVVMTEVTKKNYVMLENEYKIVGIPADRIINIEEI